LHRLIFTNQIAHCGCCLQQLKSGHTAARFGWQQALKDNANERLRKQSSRRTALGSGNRFQQPGDAVYSVTSMTRREHQMARFCRFKG
jgi:hypothetical protein